MLRLHADILKSPEVAHGFFGRAGGVSDGAFASLNCGPGSGDVPEHVCENRSRVQTALRANALVTAYQVHSAEAVSVEAVWDEKIRPHADGMATATKGIALGILTADCAPVLFADAAAGVIGASHAGWKGALAGITGSTLSAMEKLGARRKRIVTAIGPCISMANYEVDDLFRTRFLDADAANSRFFGSGIRAGHWQFNLPSYVARRLQLEGVAKVKQIAACTYARDADFFSFRRTTHRGEKDYGRQISVIALR